MESDFIRRLLTDQLESPVETKFQEAKKNHICMAFRKGSLADFPQSRRALSL